MAKRRKLVIGLLIAGCAVLAAPSAVWRVRRHYLARDLFGKDEAAAAAAVEGLARHPSAGTVTYLMGGRRTDDETERIVRVFRAMGPPAAEHLKGIALRPPLDLPEWMGNIGEEIMFQRNARREDAMWLLGSLGAAGVQPLAEIILGGVPNTDQAAVAALVAIRDPAAAEAMKRIVGKYPNMAWRVITSLAGTDTSEAADRLEWLRMEGPQAWRGRAALALAVRATGRERTNMLLLALEGGDFATVASVATQVAWHDDPRVTPGLLAALERLEREGTSAFWRQQVVTALGRRKGGVDEALVRQLPAGDAEEWVSWDTEVLDHDRFELAIAAVFALAEQRDSRALAPLDEYMGLRVYYSEGRPWDELDHYEAGAVALEKLGTPEARAAVNGYCARGTIRLSQPRGVKVEPTILSAARNYKPLLRTEWERSLGMLLLALERHGTPEMAADFIRSESTCLVLGAVEWAARHGRQEEVKALLTDDLQRRAVDDPAVLYPVPALDLPAWQPGQ